MVITYCLCNSALAPTLPVSELPSPEFRRALPPPSPQYFASVAPTRDLLFQTLALVDSLGDLNDLSDDQLQEAIDTKAWCDFWLDWYDCKSGRGAEAPRPPEATLTAQATDGKPTQPTAAATTRTATEPPQPEPTTEARPADDERRQPPADDAATKAPDDHSPTKRKATPAAPAPTGDSQQKPKDSQNSQARQARTHKDDQDAEHPKQTPPDRDEKQRAPNASRAGAPTSQAASA